MPDGVLNYNSPLSRDSEIVSWEAASALTAADPSMIIQTHDMEKFVYVI